MVGDNSATGLLAFGLIFNGVLFVIPGLILCGIGTGLRRQKRSTSGPQSARGIEATKPPGPKPARVIEESDGERGPCPYCAELIVPAAKVCRFCSRELPPGWADVAKTPAQARVVPVAISPARANVARAGPESIGAERKIPMGIALFVLVGAAVLGLFVVFR
jgi:hypothetical protein